MEHPFEPVYNKNSRVLILGSFPSVRSRKDGFFYGHPQNRFWRVLASVYKTDVPQTVEEKKQFLFDHGIALWDVIASCEVENSADGSIRGAKPNDFSDIFKTAKIKAVFTNGKLAYKLYGKHVGRDAFYLPSTSPANATWSLERLISEWNVIYDYTLDIKSSM
jgi:hypoxanthine-DNA glycosylase